MFMRAVHPGEVLKDELDELSVTPTEFARHWFGTDPQFWLNLQSAYEIRIAEEKAGREIAALPVRAGAARPDAPVNQNRAHHRAPHPKL